MIFISKIFDPFKNLSIEHALLSKIPKNEKWLFVYQNEPSIVMGRFQNPWLECDINRIKQDGIHFVRRQSGGGTVYHDSQNVNFSFLQGKRDHDKDINNEILINALRNFGLNAYASGRSDLLIMDGVEKKISGSAFKQKKSSSFHHGTMLINTELDKLNNYLMSKHTDIEAKGIKSVKSTVQNLNKLNSEITVESYIQAVQRSFCRFKGAEISPMAVDESDMDQQYLLSLKSWDWVFGETPFFELEREVNNNRLTICAKKGLVIKVEIHSDSFEFHLLNLFCSMLVGCRLERTDLDRVLTLLQKENNLKPELIYELRGVVESFQIFI